MISLVQVTPPDPGVPDHAVQDDGTKPIPVVADGQAIVDADTRDARKESNEASPVTSDVRKTDLREDSGESSRSDAIIAPSNPSKDASHAHGEDSTIYRGNRRSSKFSDPSAADGSPEGESSPEETTGNVNRSPKGNSCPQRESSDDESAKAPASLPQANVGDNDASAPTAATHRGSGALSSTPKVDEENDENFSGRKARPPEERKDVE